VPLPNLDGWRDERLVGEATMKNFFGSDPSMRLELEQRLAAGINLPDAERLGVALADVCSCVTGTSGPDALAQRLVTAFVRPAVSMGMALGDVESRYWNRRLALAGRELSRAATAVARVWLDGHPALRWAGTCWFVTDKWAVTTRAVAQEIRHPGVKARVEQGGQSFAVVDVRTDDGSPINSLLAFLVLDGARQFTNGWHTSERGGGKSGAVATIGYSARDSRTGDPLLDLVYERSFNQKCVAPGRLLNLSDDGFLTHDCASVGNTAGAVIVDLAMGHVVGLHINGALDGPGTGVAWSTIEQALRTLGERTVVAAPELGADALERRGRNAEDYEGRQGYRSDFLGIDVPAPMAGPTIKDDVNTFTVGGKETTLLPYTHFSVCMSKARRMCRFTACNVEGGALQDVGRAGIPWRFDARFDEALQAGDDLYRDNDLDRGHMVRRLDPVWGDDQAAQAANEDTFHFTNSCPQHKDLNQKTWNDLEDYVLQNAGEFRLKINVFTGPVFRADDPDYRDFQLPLDFWKVVVMVKDDGTLSATAYTLSQRDLVTGLEFVFGEFRTYQIRLRQVEEWTGLDFGELRNFDPKDALESAGGAVEIKGPQDIQL
jgi:endonuclease G, mitochondrial